MKSNKMKNSMKKAFGSKFIKLFKKHLVIMLLKNN